MRAVVAAVLLVNVLFSGCLGGGMGTVPDEPNLSTEAGGRGVTVVAVVDSFVNPYHWDFLAAHMPQHLNSDPLDDLPLNEDPATWLPGHPGAAGFASHNRLGLTLTPDDPDAVADELYEQDAEAWASVRISDRREVNMHWIPGTKVVGFVNFRQGSDGYDDLFHGTAVASSSVGNHYGTCPECVFVFVHRDYEDVEMANEWVLEQDWIDVQINSWGGPSPLSPALSLVNQLGLVHAYDGLYAGSDTKKQARASERGQALFWAAGNGLDSGFKLPNPTLWSSQKGPDWGFTVGAIDVDEHQSFSGAGMPVDVSGIGNAYPISGGGNVTASAAFSGTSNAAPMVAGVYARALWLLRQDLGSQRMQDGGVLAARDNDATGELCGPSKAECALSDDTLGVEELREAFFRTAEHRSEGLYMPGVARVHEETAETRFSAQGHGSFLGRFADDWRSESETIAGFANGSWHEARDGDLDEWMVALSWCRQHLWGSWVHGDHSPGMELPPVSPFWPVRSWFVEECPRSGKAVQGLVYTLEDA